MKLASDQVAPPDVDDDKHPSQGSGSTLLQPPWLYGSCSWPRDAQNRSGKSHASRLAARKFPPPRVSRTYSYNSHPSRIPVGSEPLRNHSGTNWIQSISYYLWSLPRLLILSRSISLARPNFRWLLRNAQRLIRSMRRPTDEQSDPEILNIVAGSCRIAGTLEMPPFNSYLLRTYRWGDIIRSLALISLNSRATLRGIIAIEPSSEILSRRTSVGKLKDKRDVCHQ
jgi:hypothetical protein